MVLPCILSQNYTEVIVKPTEADINFQIVILEIEPQIQIEVVDTTGPQATRVDPNAKCGKNGHMAFGCWHIFDQDYQPSSSSSQSSMSAMMTTPYTAFDPNWYVDSGATNHISPVSTT